MRSNTSWVLLLGLVGSLTACSHPQGVSDAAKLDKDDTAALLAPICDDASCSTCPSFLGDADAGTPTLERVLYGSFSFDGADEALVEVSGCGGHDVVALEHRGGEWHRFGWARNMSLGDCEQVEREEGTTGLVCHTPAQLHREHKETIAMLGVHESRFQRYSLATEQLPRSCEARNLWYRRLGNWQLNDDKAVVLFERESVCLRTRPKQTLCEAEREGIEPLVDVRREKKELDWTLLGLGGTHIGNFCDKQHIRDVALNTLPAVQECVMLGGEEAQSGGYLVQWKAGLDGNVMKDSVSVLEAPTDDPAVEACLERVLSKMQFDKPDGGICIVNYPYFFNASSYWEHACQLYDPPPLEWLEAQESR